MKAAHELGGKHLALVADVADEPALVAAFERAAAFLGGLDALATCAGIAESTPFMELSSATFQRVHDVNVIGTFLCLREAARHMGPGGRMCTVASVAGQWLLGRQYVENWPVWIGVNIVSVALFAYKGLWLTVVLYVLFAVLAAVGWRVWIGKALP